MAYRMVHEKNNVELTSALTDSETGDEGLNGDLDRKRSLQALKDMHVRGLISDAIFQKKMKALEE